MDKMILAGLIVVVVVVLLISAMALTGRKTCSHKGCREYLGQLSMASAHAAGFSKRYHIFMCTECAQIWYADPDDLPKGYEKKLFDQVRAREIEREVEAQKKKKEA